MSLILALGVRTLCGVAWYRRTASTGARTYSYHKSPMAAVKMHANIYDARLDAVRGAAQRSTLRVVRITSSEAAKSSLRFDEAGSPLRIFPPSPRT